VNSSTSSDVSFFGKERKKENGNLKGRSPFTPEKKKQETN